jgi:hypothetical protein
LWTEVTAHASRDTTIAPVPRIAFVAVLTVTIAERFLAVDVEWDAVEEGEEFGGSGEPLLAELRHLRDQLDRIKAAVRRSRARPDRSKTVGRHCPEPPATASREGGSTPSKLQAQQKLSTAKLNACSGVWSLERTSPGCPPPAPATSPPGRLLSSGRSGLAAVLVVRVRAATERAPEGCRVEA